MALTAPSLALSSARLPGRNGPSRSSAKHRRPPCIAAGTVIDPLFGSTSELPSSPCPAHTGLLSWGWTGITGSHRRPCPSPLRRPSVSGLLSRGHRARPLPDGKQASRPSAPGCQSRSPVPSSWFRTTSTVFSARRLEGLLHPSADHGVRPVSRATVRRPARFPERLPPLEELPRPAVGSPVTRCLGPLDVPARSAVPSHRCRCQPRCRDASSSSLSPSRLFPSNRSVTPTSVAGRRRPVLPGLLIPLRGHHRTVAAGDSPVTGAGPEARPPVLGAPEQAPSFWTGEVPGR